MITQVAKPSTPNQQSLQPSQRSVLKDKSLIKEKKLWNKNRSLSNLKVASLSKAFDMVYYNEYSSFQRGTALSVIFFRKRSHLKVIHDNLCSEQPSNLIIGPFNWKILFGNPQRINITYSQCQYNKIIMQNQIKSIEKLVQYFKSTKRRIFTLGPIIGTNFVNINDFIPTFQIISCNDPYFGAHPFITVPEFIKKNHTCSLGTKCEIQLLSNPEVIAYMKSKDPSPSLVLLLFDAKLEEICKANGINVWFPQAWQYNYLNNKVKIVDELKKAGIPHVPNVCSKIDNYSHFLELTKDFGARICVQCQDGFGGGGTMKIFNEEDYKIYQSILQSGQMLRIMPYKNLKSFSINVSATKTGIFVAPLMSELIGFDILTQASSGYCGNEFLSRYFENEEVDLHIRKKIREIAEKFGSFLYENKLIRGSFGFDIAADVDTHEVFFLEVNPRMTGSSGLAFSLYQAQGYRFPFFLYHCADYLDLDLALDVRAINDEWVGTQHYQKDYSFVVFRPRNAIEQSMPFSFPAGFWKIQGDELVQVKKYEFRIDQLKQDEILFTPNVGFSKANIILRGRVQDFDRKMTKRAQDIIEQCLALRMKDLPK